MSNAEAAAPANSLTRRANDVPAMLLPVSDKLLLLPGVSVAEIVNYSYPDCPDNAPEWFLGYINWRKLSVPLVSFEMLNGQGMPRSSGSRRIAVLNNTGVSDGIPFIAILIQGIPRLLRITDRDLGDVTDAVLAPAEQLAANLPGGETVFIPDVSALERAFADYLKSC